MKKLFAACLLLCLVSCGQHGVMRVLTVDNAKDYAVLRTPCEEFSAKELKSRYFRHLAKRMIKTVTDTTQNGVGIAAPQVGVSKRLIVVCRLDQEGEPFVPYANPQIDSTFGETVIGREGCLSVPLLRGNVPRAYGIVVSYASPDGLARVSETVVDYTARIFQHEIDHLDGI
ncbi:MAG: peptide deformylase, partial [Bacteroidales bacterium]|nr:peptide deformylase [Bacteroidales bacterium]